MKSRELDFGWVPTINGLDEKSFPLGIKQVSMKELAVIFPSALIAIMFFSRNLMIAMASLVPAIYVVFYEEKSMSVFQFVYYFVRYYVFSTKTSNRATGVKKLSLEKREMKKPSYFNRIKMDLISIVAGIVLDLVAFRFLSISLTNLLITVILGSIGTSLILSEILIIQLKRVKKAKTKE